MTTGGNLHLCHTFLSNQNPDNGTFLRAGVDKYHLGLYIKLYIIILYPSSIRQQCIPSLKSIDGVLKLYTGSRFRDSRIAVNLNALKGIGDTHTTQSWLHLLYGSVGIKE